MIVTLAPWEYEHACNVGIRRYTANWNKKDAPYYKKELMEDDRTAQVAAAICELAVAKATNRFWSGHVWHSTEHEKYKHVADVGNNIEVRRVRDEKKQSVAVRKHQVGKGLVLFAAHAIKPEFREVEIWGWLQYDLAWNLAQPWEGNDTVRYLHRQHLTAIEGKDTV